MGALARALGMDVVHEDEGYGASLVMTTGTDRIDEAITIARRIGAPCVGMGDPGRRIEDLDLALPTPQFPLPNLTNVTRLDLAIDPHARSRTSKAPMWSAGMEKVGLLLVGGPAGPWGMNAGMILATVDELRKECSHLVVMTSMRTPDSLRNALAARSSDHVIVDNIRGQPVRYVDALSASAWAMVTGDSVSMISECIQAGLPTGIVPLEADTGAVEAYLSERVNDPSLTMPGDLRLFWSSMSDAGPVRKPMRRKFRDPLVRAVNEIKRMMSSKQWRCEGLT